MKDVIWLFVFLFLGLNLGANIIIIIGLDRLLSSDKTQDPTPKVIK